MTQFSLIALEARLQKIVTVTTTEIETEERDRVKGLFVFRDEAGEKFMWSKESTRYQFRHVATVAEADQIMFLCPLCFDRNGGSKGTHSVLVTFAGRNIPEGAGSRDSTGQPSRWNASGTNLADLVLTPSILLGAGQPPERGCHWHGFVGSNGIAPGHAG